MNGSGGHLAEERMIEQRARGRGKADAGAKLRLGMGSNRNQHWIFYVGFLKEKAVKTSPIE